jgi:hypothetical protein
MLQINFEWFSFYTFFFFFHVEISDQKNCYCKNIEAGLKGIRLCFCQKKIVIYLILVLHENLESNRCVKLITFTSTVFLVEIKNMKILEDRELSDLRDRNKLMEHRMKTLEGYKLI